MIDLLTEEKVVGISLKLSDKGTLLSKLVNLVSTGSPKPNLKSTQDKKVGDLKYFKVRYRYTGNNTPDRDFCKAMMSASTRLFRKEDIDVMSAKAVNPGFGENGANTYDIFRFKGGARCHHFWMRKTYLAKGEGVTPDVGNPNAEVSVNKAKSEGVPLKANPKDVARPPMDMDYSGFTPEYAKARGIPKTPTHRS